MSDPRDAVIDCRSLWKVFGARADEAMKAIRKRDASFTVHEGEIFCIMGLSGSGKSTLIRYINRLIEPTAGEVLIESVDVNKLGRRQLRASRTGTNLEEKFQHKILYRALEELGYQIAEPEEVEYQTIHLALGKGDGDFTAVHWDPLHKVFFEESGGEEAMAASATTSRARCRAISSTRRPTRRASRPSRT